MDESYEHECPVCCGGCLYQDRHDQTNKVAHCDNCGEEIPEEDYLKIVGDKNE